MKRGNAGVPAHENFVRQKRSLAPAGLEGTFDRIHAANLWGSEESKSGKGSEFSQTGHLVKAIPALLRELKVRVLLDAPCGDLAWMRNADLTGVDYIGGDIVERIVADNQEKYGGPVRRFLRLDLTQDPLPEAGLLHCRDCLVHLSHRNVWRAIANFKRSGIEWLLTTNFPLEDENLDIEDGDWRPLNFERAPFWFPPPVRSIVEGCTEEDGRFADKALGLWRVADLPLAGRTK